MATQTHTTPRSSQPSLLRQQCVYDYSQPIDVTSAPPDAAAATSTEQVFSAARDSFKAGDFQRALDLADQVLKQTPNVAVVHEFRALCLFALKRYDEAAAVNYSVLTAGPGWNWSTLVGLYPDVDTYTNQLRALEAYAKSNPNSASAQFLLAYFYMVQGNNDAAGAQFERVAQLQPQDQLSSSFAKLYKKAAEQPAAEATIQPTQNVVQNQAEQPAVPPGQPPAVANNQQPATVPAPPGETADQQQEPPPPPPAELVGNWKAQPAPDVTIALAIQTDGQFSWEVNTKGQKANHHWKRGFQGQYARPASTRRAATGRQSDAARYQQVSLRSSGRWRQGRRPDLHKIVSLRGGYSWEYGCAGSIGTGLGPVHRTCRQRGWENGRLLGIIKSAIATCFDPADSIAMKRAHTQCSGRGMASLPPVDVC